MSETLAADRQEQSDGSAQRGEVRIAISGGDPESRYRALEHLRSYRTVAGVPYRGVDLGPGEGPDCETWEERKSHLGVGEGDAGLDLEGERSAVWEGLRKAVLRHGEGLYQMKLEEPVSRHRAARVLLGRLTVCLIDGVAYDVVREHARGIGACYRVTKSARPKGGLER